MKKVKLWHVTGLLSSQALTAITEPMKVTVQKETTQENQRRVTL